jgi:hypothetical protein
MTTIVKKTLLAVAALAACATAWAHHSAVAFDFGKSVTYTGTVKEFRAVEPHLRVVLEWKDAKGADHLVRFEGHSLNNLYRAGYRKDMVKVGDTLTVTAAPYRNGDEGGYVIGGQVKGAEYWGMKSRGAAPADTKAVGEEVRRQAEGR